MVTARRLQLCTQPRARVGIKGGPSCIEVRDVVRSGILGFVQKLDLGSQVAKTRARASHDLGGCSPNPSISTKYPVRTFTILDEDLEHPTRISSGSTPEPVRRGGQ
jgi:hypothetical protein